MDQAAMSAYQVLAQEVDALLEVAALADDPPDQEAHALMAAEVAIAGSGQGNSST